MLYCCSTQIDEHAAAADAKLIMDECGTGDSLKTNRITHKFSI